MDNNQRIYLDTSVISALFDDRNPDRRDITRDFFLKIDKFDTFVSDITVDEVNDASNPKLRSRMREAISRFTVLPMTANAEQLARAYVRHGAVPESNLADAFHIAIAVLNGIGFLLSWNFRHIVRLKTRDIVLKVNALNRLPQITILTPGEMI
jgi:predicted nucleic acid-binding protein